MSEINGPSHVTSQVSGQGNQAKPTPAKTVDDSQRQPLAADQDSVSLTKTATHLQEAEAKLATTPVVDTKRVEAIRQAVVEGAYQVDANRVADKLTRFEQLLVGPSK